MKKKLITGIAVLLLAALPAFAQKGAEISEEEAFKQANNPLASIKTFNVHNYIVPLLYGVPDATANQLWIRYAQPIGPIIFRLSIPFVTESAPGQDPEAGLGDINAFFIYKFPFKSEAIEVGIGPLVTFPSGTNDMGQGKWQLGASAVAFLKSNPQLQLGTLLSWQMSIAGDDNRSDVNLLTTQLFFLWQLGGGTYLRSTGIWTFDFVNTAYNIPIGLGIGKVIKSGRMVYNIFMEPQYSVYAEGIAQPQVQIFIGFNTQIH